MSEYQSSNTLLNSTKSITIPKENRFKFLYRKAECDNIFKLNSCLSNRSTSQGFANKLDFTKSAKKTPAPNTYNLSSSFFFNKNKAPSLRLKLPVKFDTPNPGVGEYNLTQPHEEKEQREKIRISIKSRQFFFYDDDLKKKQFCVSPQAYYINDTQVQNSRFSNVSFGKGVKFNYVNCK